MAISPYTKICSKNIGGNMYVFLTEVANISSVTIVGDEVTGITMVGAATFKQIQADTDGIVRLCTQGGNGKANLYYNHSVSMTASKAALLLNTLADQLSEASACGIVAIVMDSNGQAWLVGWNEIDKGKRPLFLQGDNFTSGKDLTEEEGGKRIFELFTTSGYIDLPLNSTLNTSISDAIAAGGGSAIEWSPTLYGPELAGGWNTAAFWDALDAGWSVAEGVSLDCDGTASAWTRKDAFWDVAKTYRIVVTNTLVASEFDPPCNGVTSSGVVITTATTTEYDYGPVGGTAMRFYSRGGFSGTITALSIKEII